MAVYTDIASEIYAPGKGTVPAGVNIQTGRNGPVSLTRVEITRQGLARPAGRYSLLELPSLAVVDGRNELYVNAVAGEIASMLPACGTVLAVGVGNRRVTADALGPRTADGVLVTRGLDPGGELGLREVCRVSPGASGETGVPLAQLLMGLVRAVHPAAVVCIDSLRTAEPARLGRSVQVSDTGLCPTVPKSSRCVTRAMLGVPVIALGVPTLMDADEAVGRPGLVVVPAQLDSVVKNGAGLLSLALNKALQKRLSIAELCYLAN